jgi:hypothetical protein
MPLVAITKNGLTFLCDVEEEEKHLSYKVTVAIPVKETEWLKMFTEEFILYSDGKWAFARRVLPQCLLMLEPDLGTIVAEYND